jgi:ABC-type lipoprotein export system ATPase subunit
MTPMKGSRRMTEDLLRLQGVSKSYRRGDRRLRVLVDVSLVVARREIVSVVGSRYEGKTTLLQVAAGLASPEEGEVWFEQVELTSCRPHEREELLGREIAWIDRYPRQPRFRIVDCVGLPLAMGRGHSPRQVRELALAALERVDAADCARQYWSDLSNWERVLVALARGIVSKPRLMIVDDLLEGLGMQRTQDACELFAELAREVGCGVLMSVSDVESTLLADRVLAFERGHLKLMAGEQQGGEADLIQFPGESRGWGARGAGA